MSKLLHVDSSGRGSTSVTQSLTSYFANKWKEAHPQDSVVYRNLSESGLHFLDANLIAAFYTPENQQTAEQKTLLAKSNTLLSEIFDADTYVFGVPMYNFSVPAVFKAYIDLIARVGKTFSYENGRPAGLLTNKKLFVITSSGGDYTSGPMKSFDFVEPYLRAVMGFMGITDVTFIKAHGSDTETVSATSREAMRLIEELVRPALAK